MGKCKNIYKINNRRLSFTPEIGNQNSEQKEETNRRGQVLANNWKKKEEDCSQIQEDYIKCLNQSNLVLSYIMCRPEKEKVKIAEQQVKRAKYIFKEFGKGTGKSIYPDGWKI